MQPLIDLDRMLTLGAMAIVVTAAGGYLLFRGIRSVTHGLRKKKL